MQLVRSGSAAQQQQVQQQQRCSHRIPHALCPLQQQHQHAAHPLLERRRPQAQRLVCRAGGKQQAAQATAVSPPPQPPSSTWVWEESEDGTAAYAAFFAWLALGALPAVQSIRVVDPALVYFVGLGVLTVYIGSHRGLTSKSRQQLSMKEGALAPVLASASLFGLYLLLKYFPDLSLQTFLDAYFFLIGSVAITSATRPLFKRAAPGGLGSASLALDVPPGWLLDEAGDEIQTLRCAPSDVAAVAVAVGLAGAELASHHTSFTLNNLVACAVATEILALVGLRSFRTAALLLLGLLCYDVFWVFGSPTVVGENVMLQVATSDIVTGPTRLLFPRVPGGSGEAANFPFSLLGLGDLALPGLLAGLALRFDAATLAGAASAATATALGGAAAASALPQQQQQGTSSAPPPVDPAVLKARPYFTRVLAAHVAGLLAAFAANAVTGLGQPALLYICPATLLAVAATAAARGSLHDVWSFTDVDTYGLPAVVEEESRKKG